MLYRLVRPLATVALLVFFKRIFLEHRERLPRDRPVILAVNHPTAFLEACILACMLDRPLYFLVRGDFFEKKIFNFLLRALHMLPVYRRKDKGLRAVKDNYTTFEACYRALAEKKTLMVLAEGSTIHAKRLRPLKRAVARVAFGAIDSGKVDEVFIVPLGVTFTNASRFRSEVLLSVGEPLRASDFLEEAPNSRKQGAERLNAELYERLSRQMVLIADPEDDALVEDLLDMQRAARPDGRRGLITGDRQRLGSEQALAEELESLSDTDKRGLRSIWAAFRKELSLSRLQMGTIVRADKGKQALYWLIPLGAPLYALGWLLNSWPFLLLEWLLRTRVPVLEYRISLRVSVGLFAWIFWWLGIVLLVGIAGGPWWGLLALMPLTGLFCVFYTDLFRNWQSYRSWKKLSDERRRELVALRDRLFSRIGALNLP